MSTHGGDIFFDIKANTKPYDRTMSGLEASASKVARKIGTKLAAGLSVAALVKFTKAATDAGASLNAMSTIIDAALPHMTKQVDAFAKSAGAAFGLSETQAKGFVGKLASMATSMGYTEEQAYKMSTSLTGLAGDMASYYHISADEAYGKLTAVFTGETEALKQLGISMTQTALDTFALEQGFGKTTREMSESEKVMLRYAFLMERLKLAQGDFNKYNQTWSGSLATIRLNWSNFMATVGQGLINILLPLLQVIARISAALTSLGQKFLAWTKRIRGIKDDAKEAVGTPVQDDATIAAEKITDVGDSIGLTSDNAQEAKKNVQELRRELMGFDRITKLSKDQNIDTDTNLSNYSTPSATVDTSALSPEGAGDQSWIDKLLGKYSKAKVEAEKFFKSIKVPPALAEAWNKLADAFSRLFNDVLKPLGKWTLENVLKPLGKWFLNEALPVMIEGHAAAIDVLTAALKLLGAILKPLWEPILKPLFKGLGKLSIFLMEFNAKKLEVIAKALEWLAEKITQLWKTLGKGKKWLDENFAAPVGQAIIDSFNWIKKKTKQFIKWWSDLSLKEIVAKISLKDYISDKIKTIKKRWQELKTKVKNILFKIDVLNNPLKIFQSLIDKFKELQATIKDLRFTIFSKEEKETKSTKSSGGGSQSIFKDLWAAFTGKTKGNVMDAITAHMATGGVVKRNSPQLAVIGDNRREGEVVSPDSKLQAMADSAAANAGGNAQTIALLNQILQAILAQDTNVYLDGEQIKNNVVQRLNQHTRATGQPELIY